MIDSDRVTFVSTIERQIVNPNDCSRKGRITKLGSIEDHQASALLNLEINKSREEDHVLNVENNITKRSFS